MLNWLKNLFGGKNNLIGLDHEIERWEAPLSYYYKKEGYEGLDKIVKLSRNFRKRINSTPGAFKKGFVSKSNPKLASSLKINSEKMIKVLVKYRDQHALIDDPVIIYIQKEVDYFIAINKNI